MLPETKLYGFIAQKVSKIMRKLKHYAQKKSR